MTFINGRFLLASICLTLVAYAPLVLAKDHGHGKGHGQEKYKKHDRHDRGGYDDGQGDKHGYNRREDHRESRYYRFNSHDRVAVQGYLVGHYRSNCPPGLARKHNGCLPPGQAKRYRVGYPLAEGLVYEYVPEPLLVQLEPVPYGYQYVMVDKDVLLISEASHKVIDAITLLSAVGR